MRKYLLPEKGEFYKANLHCHSTYSDGNWTPEEIKERYRLFVNSWGKIKWNETIPNFV